MMVENEIERGAFLVAECSRIGAGSSVGCGVCTQMPNAPANHLVRFHFSMEAVSGEVVYKGVSVG